MKENDEIDEDLWDKAERLVQLVAKGINVEELEAGTGKEIHLLCPTCFRTREGYISDEIWEKLDGANHSILNQCDYCRDKGREVDLDHLKAVMTEKIAPLPKLDDTTSFSDLIKELVERIDEE